MSESGQAVEQTAAAVERVMTPLGSTVIVEVLPDADVGHGLILPVGARVKYDRAKRARVVDAGPEVRGMLPGDEVLVTPLHDGVEVSVPGTGHDGGTRFRIIDARAVVAVLTPEPPLHALFAARARIDEAIARQRAAAAA